MRWVRIALPLLLIAAAASPPAAAQLIGGLCKFDVGQLSFVGSAAEQAACLLRAPKKWGELPSQPITLPEELKGRVGLPTTITRAALRNHLASVGLAEASVGGSLDEPLSRARDNQPTAPMARYFVIHDTSSPYFKDAPFPQNIDTDEGINRLGRYAGPQAVAHAFNNRMGHLLIGHLFSVPWRATKLEQQIGIPSKGLFIHVENVQPRRRDPVGGATNDAIAPVPGFSDAQYRSLALLYVVSSVRAGQWLTPAFHAAIDEALSGGHDDPQNFDLSGKFVPAIVELTNRLAGN